MKIKWVLFLFEWRSRDRFKGIYQSHLIGGDAPEGAVAAFG